MVMNSVQPISTETYMNHITWSGFKDIDVESQYSHYRTEVLGKLSTCFSFLGIMYCLSQILTIIIWDFRNPPMVILTVMCISLLIFVGIHLSSMITEIQDKCNKYIMVGIVAAITVQIYTCDAIYSNSHNSLCWSLVLSFILFGCLALSFKLRSMICFMVLIPDLVFIVDYTGADDRLNGAIALKILQYLLFSISILILGMSMYFRIDMELRKTFYKHRTLKAGNQATIKRLIDQEKLVFGRLSYRIGTDIMFDIGRGDEIHNRKLYTYRYSSVSILVLRLTNLSVCYGNSDPALLAFLNEIFTELETLSQKNNHQILTMFHDGFVCICEEQDNSSNPAVLSVYMGLGLIDTVRTIAGTYRVDITAKVGIHKGDLLTAAFGQHPMQLDVFGKDYIIACKLAELGDPGTMHCSQFVKCCEEYNIAMKENLRMSRDGFLRMNGIKSLQITIQLNQRRHQRIIIARFHSYSTILKIMNGGCQPAYKTTGQRYTKHRRKLKCCLGSLLTVPVVLICQFCLVIVQQPLLIYETVTFGISISILILTPCFVVWRTRRQVHTRLQIFHTLTMFLPNKPCCLVLPMMSVVLFLLCNVLTVIGNEELRSTTFSNTSNSSEGNMLYLQSNNSVLTLCVIANIMFSYGIQSVCLIGSLIVYWTVDMTIYNNSGYTSGHDVIKSLINITGIVICLLHFDALIQKTMFHVTMETVTVQDENLLHLENKMKSLISRIEPSKHMNFNMQESYQQQYSNLGVMYASCPDLCHKLTNASNMESVNLLHEMILSFDQLLQEERFSRLRKIKSNQLTYTVVIGMETIEQTEIEVQELNTLLQLAFAMETVAATISNPVDDGMELCIGIHHGPVVTGFVGLNKNYFQIWGTTVDIVRSVSLMGQRGQIMVSCETKMVLEKIGCIFIEGEPDLVNDDNRITAYSYYGQVD